MGSALAAACQSHSSQYDGQQSPYQEMNVRSYVLYGQFNVAGTLPSLAQRLRQFGRCTTHSWNDNSVLSDLKTQKDKVALIGYSLGANALPWIAENVHRTVDLIVGYDPSRLSPLARWDSTHSEYVEVVPANVQKAICFYNPTSWYYGGARYVGKNIITVPITAFHLLVATDSSLHERTFQAVKSLAG